MKVAHPVYQTLHLSITYMQDSAIIFFFQSLASYVKIQSGSFLWDSQAIHEGKKTAANHSETES